MQNGPIKVVMDRLLVSISPAETGDLSDVQLLALFVDRRDPAAFEAILRRHGPMVMSVCNRMLTHFQDAEDAFQATFFVLARKAAIVRPREKLANWLYGVAHRAALKTRQLVRKKNRRETQVTHLPEPMVMAAGLWNDVVPLLDEAIARLPEKYRVPIVLCDLEGITRKKAALQLGWPEGTVAGRLAEGRALLARRLRRQGVAVSGGVLSSLLAENALAGPLGNPLISTLIEIALSNPSGVASTSVATIVAGVLNRMITSKTKSAFMIVAVFAIVLCGYIAISRSSVVDPKNVEMPNGSHSFEVAEASFEQDPGEKEPPKRPDISIPLAILGSGHRRGVLGVVYSLDGKTIASASHDGTIKFWDAASGRNVRTFRDVETLALCMVFSPDGKTLAVGGRTGQVTLYRPDSKKAVETLQVFDNSSNAKLYVTAVAFSSDGKTLAAAGPSVKLIDLESGKEERSFEEAIAPIRSVAFSPDKKLLAIAGKSNELIIRDVSDGARRNSLSGHAAAITDVAFSADGKTIATAGADKKAMLWDVGTGKRLATFAEHTNRVLAVAFSRDGTILATGSADRTARLWDIDSAKELASLRHRGEVRCLAFSGDGKSLVTGSLDSSVRVWDTAKGANVHTFEGHLGTVVSLAFSPDGKTLVSGAEDSYFKLWDVENRTNKDSILANEFLVNAIAFNADNKTIATGGRNQDIQIRYLPLNVIAYPEFRSRLPIGTNPINALVFSPDGRELVSGSGHEELNLFIWDAKTGIQNACLKGHELGVTSVAISPNGKFLASGSLDKTTMIWDYATRKRTCTIKFDGAVTALAWTKDGTVLASGGVDGQLRLWDTSGKPIRTLEGHREKITGLGFTLDGKKLVSSSWDKTVKVWDVESGGLEATLGEHPERVNALQMSPDGKLIAVASDNTVILWSVSEVLSIGR